jgi:hypothetical protein
MKRGMLSMSRIIASAAILLSIGMIPPTTQKTTTQSPDEAQARIEVRIRKLHLVRPDLIPYPIHFDVYC